MEPEEDPQAPISTITLDPTKGIASRSIETGNSPKRKGFKIVVLTLTLILRTIPPTKTRILTRTGTKAQTMLIPMEIATTITPTNKLIQTPPSVINI